ncbi:WSC-domain-containing protein, partial [Exidia glandulosa HHB12029]
MAALKSLLALSLFAISAAAAGTLLPAGWSVLDQCAVDVPSRLFKSVKIKNLSNNTPQDCVYYCDSLGYTYAGVEYGTECHCGRGYDTAAAASAPASECNMPCTGDSSQKCGAGWRIQVFVSNDKLPASPVLPDGWSTAYGCAVDSGDRVLLHNKMFTLPKSNSPAACVQKCASVGATHAGVEYGSECHCGVGYLWQPVSAPIEQCDMDCTGNSYYNCGSGYRISIYTL